MEPRITIVSHRIDSALGCWTQTEWRPAHLAGIAERLWHFDGWITFLRERVFPNGLLELIVHLGDRYRLIEEKGAEICPAVCVSGLYTSPSSRRPPRPCRVLGVRLTPVGAYAILGCPLSEMNGLSLDLEDVVGRAGAELAERCHAAPASRRLRTPRKPPSRPEADFFPRPRAHPAVSSPVKGDEP
jgi:hypothetical protein